MVKKVLARSYLSIILFVMYAPILLLIVYSFTDTTNIGPWNGFSFKLYAEMFANEEIMTALLNTVLIAIASSVVSTCLGTLGAIGIFYSGKKAKRVLNGITQIPILNAEIVTAISLTILFVTLGVTFNFITLLIGHVVLTIPFVVLSVIPKLKQMDVNMYEAALDLGATPAIALRKVIVPEVLPGILSGFLLCITLSLDDYIITAFTRDNSFSTLSTYVYGVTAKRGALPASLRALTTLITVVMFVGLMLSNFAKKKQEARSNALRVK